MSQKVVRIRIATSVSRCQSGTSSGEIGVHLGRLHAAAGERLLQPEQRPAVVRVMLELVPIDLLRVRRTASPRAAPRRASGAPRTAAARARRRSSASCDRRGLLERRDRAGQIAAAAQNLAVENGRDDAEQVLRGVDAERRPSTCRPPSARGRDRPSRSRHVPCCSCA